MSSGPVIIGFDGTPASERVMHEAAALFAPRRALVVVVWEAGRAFDGEVGTILNVISGA